jgi:hypothetical protein
MTESPEIIRIGITGHRFISNLEKLTESLEKAFQFLTGIYPLFKFEVYSGLAEGADRLAAKVLFEYQVFLTAALPLPLEEYQKDFTSNESMNELQILLQKADKVIILSNSSEHSQGYAALGDYLLQNSNILITLWDGNASTSPGSTGYISNCAIAQKLPVIWIQTENRNPQNKSVGKRIIEQGYIEYINFGDL